MGQRRNLAYAVIFSVVLGALAILSFLSAGDPLPQLENHIPHYAKLVEEQDPLIQIAYETQALPLLEKGIIKSYRSDFVSTVIIAIDRDRVEDQVTGWASLANGDFSIFFPHDNFESPTFIYTVLAIASGLDFSNGGYVNTIRLLKEIVASDRLVKSGPDDAQVAIIFDHEAAAMIKAGRNLEIVVPKEGTLSFPGGMISFNSPTLPTILSVDLLLAGFRLPNGQAHAALYPAADAYRAARIGLITNQKALEILKLLPSFRRRVLSQRRLAPAHHSQSAFVYTFFIVIVVFWSGLLFMRTSGPKLQRRLFAISGFLVLWMIIRITKLMLPHGPLERFFWYMYYIPLNSLPALLISVGLLGMPKEKKVRAKYYTGVIHFIALSLQILILTNDYHQMAFRFYVGMEGNNYLNYTYGWVYYVIFIWSLVLVLAFLFITHRVRERPSRIRSGSFFLIIVAAVIYFGGYAARVPILRDSEFSIVWGILTLLFVEKSLRDRLIPNNILLGELLRNAALDLQIISKDLEIQYKTNHSHELPAAVLEHVATSSPEGNLPAGFTVADDDTLLYGVYEINGGYTVFTQHLEEIKRLRATLSAQHRKLEVQNGILAHTHSVTGQMTRLQAQQEIHDRITQALRGRVKKLNGVLGGLPDRLPTGLKGVLQEEIGRLRVLVNYCKRRGNLALLEVGDENCGTASLALWLQESIWEAGSAGIDGTVTERVDEEISSAVAALVYDVFQHVLESLLWADNAVIVAYLNVAWGVIKLRAVSETTPPLDPIHLEPHGDLGRFIEAFNASYVIDEHDDGLIIELSIPLGGRNHD